MAREQKRKVVADLVFNYGIVSKKTGGTYDNCFIELPLSNGRSMRFYPANFLSSLEFGILEDYFTQNDFLKVAKLYKENELQDIYSREV